MLGVLSFFKDVDGKIICEVKWYLMIEDNVVIYVNVIVLGGKMIIGYDLVIGFNVWLMSFIELYMIVLMEKFWL